MSACINKYNKKQIDVINKFLHIIHDNFIESNKYIDKLEIIQKTGISFNDNFNKKLLPENIINYIRQTKNRSFEYNAIINNRNVILKIYIFNKQSKSAIDKYAIDVFKIIYVLSLYCAKKCAKTIFVNLFLTPFKKNFPLSDEILGIDNVNSGYSTSGCINKTEITIYREEEWIKVLFHELFHNLNLDFANLNINKFKSLLHDHFQINSLYDITETYCEIWARILNVIFHSFTLNKGTFLSNFYNLIQKEQIFSLKQSTLILKRFKSAAEYREKSNVFCYYIFTAALLNNYLDFFIWCNEYNTNLLNFKKQEKNVKLFIDLILKEVDCTFIHKLHCINKFINNSKSLRMSVVE